MRGQWWRSGVRSGRGTVVVFPLAFVLGLGLSSSVLAGAATHQPAVTTLQEQLGTGQSVPTLPPACNLSWPTKAWPAKMDPAARARMLHLSDVPPGLREAQAALATNGPDLDQLAVGFPHAVFAEMAYFGRGMTGVSIDEIVGRLRTHTAAVSTYRHARDVIFGSCERYWDFNGPTQPRYPLPGRGPGLFAFESLSGTRYNSFASITVLGYRGPFVFDLSVGNYITYPATGIAVLPPYSAVSAVLTSALNRLAH